MRQFAHELGNVSKASRIVGYSRQQFFEIRRSYQLHGAERTHNRLPGAKGPHPNRVPESVEKAILAHALEHPTRRAQRVADELMLTGIPVSSGGVRGGMLGRTCRPVTTGFCGGRRPVRKRKIKLTEEQIPAIGALRS